MKPIIKADAVPTIFKREPPGTKKLILKIKAWQITIITLPQYSENKHKSLYFSKTFFEGLIFGGSYIRREICVSKSVRLILGERDNLRLKNDWAIVCSAGAFRVAETSLREFQHGAFASKNIRAPDENACTVG